MYAAYGLVSQRPFAVLDRHLLGTAKGLQTKGCSVGGDRAPSHSCDRRRKEKSGQAHSGLPVCTTEGAWATPRTKHGIIALSVKLTRVAGDKRPGCPQCGNAIFKPSQRIWDVACCIWRPVREAPILRIRAK